MKNTLKNKNKNLKLTTLGFTLIELLAVIVILAIIALIATPIILGIVEDARKDSFMRSVELVINATDIDIFNKNYNDTYTYTINDGNVSNLEIGVKNTDGMNGSITYDKNGNDIYAIHNGKYCVIKEEGMKKAEIKDYVEGECKILMPTDASYFGYVEILRDFRIADIDACVEFFVEEFSDEDYATSICNNEPQNRWDELTLTEYANENPTYYYALALVESGALTGTSTNTIEIKGYSEEGPKDVVIPSRINGKEVVTIGIYAFSESNLTSVVIPNTVTIIKEWAFHDNDLTSVTIPESVTYIGGVAFSSNLLTNIVLSTKLEVIAYQAFYNNSLQEVTIPESVSYIGSSAFELNPLQTVIIENDDVEIDTSAFCDTSISETSEIYQKIYNINSEAFSCFDPV